MATTEQDIELLAARVRLHFSPELRDTAYELAYAVAKVVGPKVKRLTPNTTIDEIFGWIREEWPYPTESLDQVEWTMAMEEELGPGFVLPDDFAANADRTTFRELVEHVARNRRAA